MKSKVFSLVISVVIAFAMWVYVTAVVSPDSEKTYYNIPIILENENVLADRGLMITSQIPAITMELKGNRTDLNELNEANINVFVDLADIKAAGDHLLKFDTSYPGTIPKGDIVELSYSLDRIPITVENKLKKSVPVVVTYPGTVPEGFIAYKEDAVLDFKTIEISGPESVVKQVGQAHVEVNMEGRDETFAEQFGFVLCNAAGEPVDVAMVTTNTESVNVSVQIQRYMDVGFVVEVIDGGGATRETCEIKITPEIIRVSGSDTLLEKMSDIELGTIDLGKMKKDGELTFPIVLPEGVTNETGVTEVTVEVKFPALKTKKFSVTNIIPNNVPEDLELEIITKVLEVEIRGPVAEIDAMKASDITATVDLKGAQIGTSTIKATISIDRKFAQAGALNSYSVSANLKEPVPEDMQ